MWSVKDPDLAKQHHRNAAASTLTHLSTKFLIKGFDVAPWHIASGRMGEDELKSPLMPALHTSTVPMGDTESKDLRLSSRLVLQTLAITWSQSALAMTSRDLVAA